MAEYIDRTKLLTDINNGIKAGNYEDGYEQYQNINNMDDIIETIKYSDKADVIERSKINKFIEDMASNISEIADTLEYSFDDGFDCILKILKRNIGE